MVDRLPRQTVLPGVHYGRFGSLLAKREDFNESPELDRRSGPLHCANEKSRITKGDTAFIGQVRVWMLFKASSTGGGKLVPPPLAATLCNCLGRNTSNRFIFNGASSYDFPRVDAHSTRSGDNPAS